MKKILFLLCMSNFFLSTSHDFNKTVYLDKEIKIFDMHLNECGTYLSKGVTDKNDTILVVYDPELNDDIRNLNDTCVNLELIPNFAPYSVTRCWVIVDSCIVSCPKDKYLSFKCVNVKY